VRPSIRTALVGTDRTEPWYLELLVAVPVFAVVLAAYATGVFAIAGGVVFLPGEAAILGFLVAGALAALGRGLVVAWVTLYGALLGYAADHYLLSLPGRSLSSRVGAFLEPDGLVALAVLAVLVGTVAWLVGGLARLGVRAVGGEESVPGAE
jgi:hypothetical protein